MSRSLLPLGLCAILGPAFQLTAATFVSQHGITWTFDAEYQTGQFANGDWWVVGPVTITSISPESVVVDGVTMHGSMINPAARTGSIVQGFDSRIRHNSYSRDSNVAASMPLEVAPSSSLLSCISDPVDRSSTHVNQMLTIAVLTVLGEAPPAGSFRPPYVGEDKSIRWNKSQLDYGRLRALPPVADTPDLAVVEAYFERPWIEIGTQWTGRFLHPQLNQPNYGREMARRIELGLLSLQLDYSNEQKTTLLVRLVQYGIDVYGAANMGAQWVGNGGHNQGRKMPLLLAGSVLDKPGMIAYSDAQRHFIFQEDHQTFYVTQADVDLERHSADGRQRDPYTEEMIGMPEWNQAAHHISPTRAGSNWNVLYRSLSGNATIGHILTARLMGLREQWNWPAAFDYYERFWEIEKDIYSNGVNSMQPFTRAMWYAYRNADPTPIRPAVPGQLRIITP